MRTFVVLLLSFYSNLIVGQPNDSLTVYNRSAPGARIISVRNGKYIVFTQKINSGKNKLLLVPGGPGASFEYFEVFPTYLKDDYEIYYYSPLGSFLSDQPQDSTLQRVDEYVEELEEVRQALGLEHFFLLGHSWGGRLCLAYANKYQNNLKGLILSNATGLGKKMVEQNGQVISDYDRYQQQLIADIAETLPGMHHYGDSLRRCLITPVNQPRLMDSIMKTIRPLFVKKHFLRLATPPEAVTRSRIHSTPEIKLHWLTEDTQKIDALSELGNITVPTLFIGAHYDYIPPNYEEARRAMKKARNVTIYITPNGSHRSMWDDSENYFAALKSFVAKVNQYNR